MGDLLALPTWLPSFFDIHCCCWKVCLHCESQAKTLLPRALGQVRQAFIPFTKGFGADQASFHPLYQGGTHKNCSQRPAGSHPFSKGNFHSTLLSLPKPPALWCARFPSSPWSSGGSPCIWGAFAVLSPQWETFFHQWAFGLGCKLSMVACLVWPPRSWPTSLCHWLQRRLLLTLSARVALSARAFSSSWSSWHRAFSLLVQCPSSLEAAVLFFWGWLCTKGSFPLSFEGRLLQFCCFFLISFPFYQGLWWWPQAKGVSFRVQRHFRNFLLQLPCAFPPFSIFFLISFTTSRNCIYSPPVTLAAQVAISHTAIPWGVIECWLSHQELKQALPQRTSMDFTGGFQLDQPFYQGQAVQEAFGITCLGFLKSFHIYPNP